MIETLPPGTVLRGRYRIERPLGSGGFGHVYLALDEQSKQQFAVKEYLVTGPNGKVQLEHEARVLSQLRHPSLPAYQDAFDERGRYYIVLGYIEGSDLTDCLRIVRQKNETLPYERILTWLISICDAVSFLHNHHPPVIHRDIKPDNIRITPSGAAILVDLGNAKATEDGARTLFFIRHQGTPGYAPLEQYPGGTGTDVRSDVYALGGTLYFALTAHEPPSVSTRNTAISQGMPDLPLLQEILAQNPPETTVDPNVGKQFRLGITKPSKPAPRHSRHIAQLATLSPEQMNRLNAIIQRSMAMRPKNRYQSVADLSNDLRQVLASLPTSRPPLSSQERPIDLHSTQPDLPFLIEAWQSNQRSIIQPTQDTSDQAKPQQVEPSTPQPAPTTVPVTPASESATRCPRCQAELPKSATFCPKCGLPLSGNSPKSVRNQGSAPASQQNNTKSGGNTSNAQNTEAKDINSEPTMLYNPTQPPASRRKSATDSSAGSSLSRQTGISPHSFQAQSAQKAISRPFLQTVSPLSRPSSAVSTAQPPQTSPARHASANSATPTSVYNNHPPPSTGTAGDNSTQKYLLYAIIAFAVILLIILFLLAFHLGGKHTG